jgi:hypothetical protein
MSTSAVDTRKDILVALGLWGMVTGRGWLVKAVQAALQREGLRDAESRHHHLSAV